MVGILADDRLQFPAAQEFFFAVAQMQRDRRATRRARDGLDFELARAFGAPADPLFGLGPGTPRLDGDAVGDDEAAVEADTELADQLRVFLLVALQCRHEFARAALGDGAEVGDRLFGTQADAVVDDRDGLRRGVEAHPNIEIRRVFVQRRIVQRLEAQLVASVRRVGNHFAQKDFLVRVERMGDEVQDLLDLGLERKGLLVHDRGVVFAHAPGARPAGSQIGTPALDSRAGGDDVMRRLSGARSPAEA